MATQSKKAGERREKERVGVGILSFDSSSKFLSFSLFKIFFFFSVKEEREKSRLTATSTLFKLIIGWLLESCDLR